MTTPVFKELENEKIAMTAPVFQQPNANKWVMAFVMPSAYTVSTLPKPVDPLVTIKEIPAKKVAVLSYSGFLNERRIAEQSRVLMDWLTENHYKILSNARSAAYDPPWTLPLLRRNEVQIDIE